MCGVNLSTIRGWKKFDHFSPLRVRSVATLASFYSETVGLWVKSFCGNHVLVVSNVWCEFRLNQRKNIFFQEFWTRPVLQVRQALILKRLALELNPFVGNIFWWSLMCGVNLGSIGGKNLKKKNFNKSQNLDLAEFGCAQSYKFGRL